MSATPESPVLHGCCMTAVLCNDHPQLQPAAVLRLSFLLQLPSLTFPQTHDPLQTLSVAVW